MCRTGKSMVTTIGKKLDVKPVKTNEKVQCRTGKITVCVVKYITNFLLELNDLLGSIVTVLLP